MIKLLTPAIILMMACGIAKAGGNDETKLTKTHAIDTYVDAMTRGKLDGLSDVIDASAKFTLMQGSHMGSYTKKQLLNNIAEAKNVEQECTTNTSVFESNSNISIVRVDMQFSSFTRSNYVTIANTGKGWKIINVYSVFN